ncbi:hypothetical protein Pint_10867 [Pistacia integerrima]|uniref:Uncharacterized protein n=1 Tax=Pistacia integerrima TaxID=434235 RepID=A0ACC0XH57_9ROSI|nr:hypothetical protein Pint_10867 [Pistacia integerrima]
MFLDVRHSCIFPKMKGLSLILRLDSASL